MKKKNSDKQEAPIKEVVEQAVENIQQATAAAEEQPKQRKMVEFSFLTSIMEFATDKAQLLAFHTEAGEEVKFWISKSLSHFVANADEPEKMICRIPAWLYFKTGLNKHFPVERWSLAAL